MAIYYLFLYDVFKVQSPDLSGSGDEGIRTPDPLLARQVLSQLSYTPMSSMGPEQSLKIEQQQILILKNLAFFFGFFYQ